MSTANVDVGRVVGVEGVDVGTLRRVQGGLLTKICRAGRPILQLHVEDLARDLEGEVVEMMSVSMVPVDAEVSRSKSVASKSSSHITLIL